MFDYFRRKAGGFMGSLRDQYEEMRRRTEMTATEEAEITENKAETSNGSEMNRAEQDASDAAAVLSSDEIDQTYITEAEQKTDRGKDKERGDEKDTEKDTKNDDGKEKGDGNPNEKDKETQNSAMLRRGLRFSYGIRLIAALYLFYISFKMYQTRELNTGMNQAVSYGFMIFFIVVGIFLLVNSIRGSKKLNDEMKKK